MSGQTVCFIALLVLSLAITGCAAPEAGPTSVQREEEGRETRGVAGAEPEIESGADETATEPDEGAEEPDKKKEKPVKPPSMDTKLPAYPGSTPVKFDPELYIGTTRVAVMRTDDSIKQVYDFYKPKIEPISDYLGANAASVYGTLGDARVEVIIGLTDDGDTEIQILEVD